MKIHLNQSKRDISWKKFRFRRFRIRKNMRWTRYRSETKRKPYSSAYTTKYSQRTPPKDLKEMVTKVKDEENDSVHALVRSPPVAVPTPPSQVSLSFKNNIFLKKHFKETLQFEFNLSPNLNPYFQYKFQPKLQSKFKPRNTFQINKKVNKKVNIDNQWCLKIPKGWNVALCRLSEEKYTLYYWNLLLN